LKFKISNITNLQDARYSAAVGFDYLSFCLVRGDERKLAPAMIWNLINWLEGPAYVLEINRVSLEELKYVGDSFHYAQLLLPYEEWDIHLSTYAQSFILKTDGSKDPMQLRSVVNKAEIAGLDVKFELTLKTIEEIEVFRDIFPHIFINFPNIETIQLLLQEDGFEPFGIAIRDEGEEEMGLLNYDLIDAFWEVVNKQGIHS